jgi:hypothetical protein
LTRSIVFLCYSDACREGKSKHSFYGFLTKVKYFNGTSKTVMNAENYKSWMKRIGDVLNNRRVSMCLQIGDRSCHFSLT